MINRFKIKVTVGEVYESSDSFNDDDDNYTKTEMHFCTHPQV